MRPAGPHRPESRCRLVAGGDHGRTRAAVGALSQGQSAAIRRHSGGHRPLRGHRLSQTTGRAIEELLDKSRLKQAISVST